MRDHFASCHKIIAGVYSYAETYWEEILTVRGKGFRTWITTVKNRLCIPKLTVERGWDVSTKKGTISPSRCGLQAARLQ